MKSNLSTNELNEYLKILKEALITVDLDNLNNVVFFNSHSFYCYLSELPCGSGRQTIDDILNKIEACIPFAITDNSFALFISASSEDETKKMEALRQGFVESCKTDFLLLALQLCNSPDWDNMTKACEDLRQKNRFAALELI